MELATVLTSGVVAALVSGLVALRNNERKIVVENITQERTKWRDKIREINKEAIKAFSEKDTTKLKAIQSELRLLLNPLDKHDLDIIKELDFSEIESEHAKRFTLRLSLLLKHDWERAKQEAEARFFKRKEPIKRLSYEEYEQEFGTTK